MSKVIMGIQIGHRMEDALVVQKLLTENGCIIKTRLGLHEVSDAGKTCSEIGLVILEFIPNVEEQIAKMEEQLKTLEGVKVQKMIF